MMKPMHSMFAVVAVMMASLVRLDAAAEARPTNAPVSHSEWTTLTNCTLVSNPSNDGDSFHVKYQEKEYVFRLYFVDCPETDDRFPDRVAAQAAYFGITEQQALKVGEQAANFTRNALQNPFSIQTRWQDALGDSKLGREYGVVTANGADLGEMLVSNGLARIHGINVGGIGAQHVEKLKKVEASAKARKAGAWGLTKR